MLVRLARIIPGRQLFSLYKAPAKASINYPKPKQMTATERQPKEEKKCP